MTTNKTQKVTDADQALYINKNILQEHLTIIFQTLNVIGSGESPW